MARAMLGRPEGETVEEVVAATAWQPHIACGAFGLVVSSEKVGDERVYRLPPA